MDKKMLENHIGGKKHEGHKDECPYIKRIKKDKQLLKLHTSVGKA
jgi:hypothetical protein